MAEKDPKLAEKNAVDSGEENSPEKGGGVKASILKRFRPVIIVSLIVVVECVTAFFLSPSGNPVFAEGDLTPEQLLVLKKAGLIQPEEPETVPCVELDMGEFGVTHSSKSLGTTIQVSFHLFGVLPNGKEEEFKLLFGEKENRIRDLVRSIIRESEVSELASPGLGLIKRRILEKVNRELGKPMLQEVVFSNYSFFER